MQCYLGMGGIYAIYCLKWKWKKAGHIEQEIQDLSHT